MDIIISRQQVGLLLTVCGAFALAFAVRTRSQYSGEQKDVIDFIKKADPSFWEPTEVTIVRPLLWGGLVLISIGTLLQW